MLIADLHIHSKYSRATSRECVPEALDAWARRKGIGLVGTGDFTHPAWRAELREKFRPAEEGLYTLKGAASAAPRFVVTGEISTIYKKNGKVRKVHSLILLPNLEAAEALSRRLEAIGNIRSDGRPILGLDCRDLLEITLEASPEAVFVPAHIWTPHFSLFGAFSGFDTIEECFGDLAPHIRALETGLSSDPPMNWRLSALDGYTLISNSDAHSPSKLGREANLLHCGLSYPELARALETGEGFGGTIEFFPEEGKYHYDGHRSCGQCLSPVEAEALEGKCPVCGKRLTTGVLHRVEQLADRPEGYARPGVPRFERLAPLPEVIAASVGVSTASGKVAARYEAMLEALGPEFTILRQTPLEDIARVAGICVAEGIRRLRLGQVERLPGYDGVYGVIQLLTPTEREAYSGQVSLFGVEGMEHKKTAHKGAVKQTINADKEAAKETGLIESLNQAQKAAATAPDQVLAVVAGPGTGKTKTLVGRIAWLLEQGAKPTEITAVTFTNRAAAELHDRLERALGKRAVRGMTVGTFHAIALAKLAKHRPELRLADPWQSRDFAAAVLDELGWKGKPEGLIRRVSLHKNGMNTDTELEKAARLYGEKLRAAGLLDFDDLLLEAQALWEQGRCKPMPHLLVDEFQDGSPLQYGLLRAWSAGGKSLFVIGDPDQCIYGFRGADAACFTWLGRDNACAREINLTQNYRSTPEILRCAQATLCGGGTARILEPMRPSGPAVRLLAAEGEKAEAIFVAKEIGRLVGGVDMLAAQAAGAQRAQRSFSDCAVLYRTRRQADLLEQCLAVEGIPCVITGRDNFLMDEMVHGALLNLQARLEAGDEEAARQSPQRLLEIWMQGKSQNQAMERLINMAVFFQRLPDFLQNLTLGQEGDLLRRAGGNYAAGAVTLSTFHGAKGLEFPVVFLCGVSRGTIPLERVGREVDWEEERRLLYVGMTRAQEELLLVTGKEESPFLRGIPQEILARTPVAGWRPKQEQVQFSLF